MTTAPKLSAKDFVDTAKTASLVPTVAHGMAMPSSTEGAIKDVISQFWNPDKMSAKDAQAKLVAAAKTKYAADDPHSTPAPCLHPAP